MGTGRKNDKHNVKYRATVLQDDSARRKLVAVVVV